MPACMHAYIHVCVPSYMRMYIHTYVQTHMHTYMVMDIALTIYHAVYWSYRASRTERWFLACSIMWVPGLPEESHNMMEDLEDRGYRPARLSGQWQLQRFSISNGDERWPVASPGVRGQGMAT